MNDVNDIDEFNERSESKMRNDESGDTEMRKTKKCANLVEVTFFCELVGYDLKTLNTATGKGSYMFKVGSKTLTVPYETAKKKREKNVPLTLYKIKGLRGFFRRAAEIRLLKLRSDGNVEMGPCTPTANYPHAEILEKHLEMGYHKQGSCKPMCFVNRLFGSLNHTASIKIYPPFIAKPMTENVPSKVNEYLDEKVGQIFGLDYCIVYHNGESTLKTETFNIINRTDEQAVNNFMKHAASGMFPFKIVFIGTMGQEQELLENIGFFIATLFEINGGKVQLGADKNNGSGQVKIRIKNIKTNKKFAGIEKFVDAKEERIQFIEFCDIRLQESVIEYHINKTFGEYALKAFNTTIGVI